MKEGVCVTTGEKIRKIRKEQGLTQEELAKKIGIKRGTLAQYESGKRSPKKETIEKFANALGVDAKELGYYHYRIVFKDDKYNKWMESIEKAVSLGPTVQDQKKELCDAFADLNYEGRAEAIKRVQELTRLRQYSYSLYDDAEHTAKLVAHAIVEETKQAEMENRGLSEEKLAFMFRQMMLGEWTPPTDDQQKAENSQDAAGPAADDTPTDDPKE